MKYGVQIFGCLKEFRDNPDEFFKKLSEIGYSQIEPCVLFGDTTNVPPQFLPLLWKPEEVPEFVEMMKKYDLTLTSCHVFAVNPLACVDKMIELAKATTIDTYAFNCGGDYAEIAKTCDEIAAQLKKHNIEYWIHNGSGEVKNKVMLNGKEVSALEATLALCKEDIGVQVDVGWVLYGGEDPAEYIKKLGSYVRSVHFKDIGKDYKNLTGLDLFAVLGEGAVECEPVLDAVADRPEIGILIDQDASKGDFFEDLEKSVELLKSLERK